MNRLLDNDADSGYTRRPQPDDDEPADREISLGTPTILGIFFAFALLCACFFGFGYTMGRKSAQSATVTGEAPPAAFSNAVKPAAGSPAGHQSATPAPPPQIPSSAVVVPNTPPPTTKGLTAADTMIVGDKPAAAVQPASASQQPAGSFYVQVAAVSSQDVADIELAALAKKGYTVAVRHEPQDQLLHIQIGPFTTRKDADAMRQRVLADGFNAIVK